MLDLNLELPCPVAGISLQHIPLLQLSRDGTSLWCCSYFPRGKSMSPETAPCPRPHIMAGSLYCSGQVETFWRCPVASGRWDPHKIGAAAGLPSYNSHRGAQVLFGERRGYWGTRRVVDVASWLTQ